MPFLWPPTSREYLYIVDIGGGQRKLLRSIVQLNPGIKGILFDLEPAIEIAKEHLSSDACGGRCSAVVGDFFESVPEGAHAYILCGVIHDWNVIAVSES